MKSWHYIAVALLVYFAWWWYNNQSTKQANERTDAGADGTTYVATFGTNVTVNTISDVSRQNPTGSSLPGLGSSTDLSAAPIASRMVMLN